MSKWTVVLLAVLGTTAVTYSALAGGAGCVKQQQLNAAAPADQAPSTRPATPVPPPRLGG
jgi:hypothetical protein